MKWYEHPYWDEETHREFFAQYRKAPPEVKGIGLIKQAEMLSDHLQDEVLKAAESLLTLWITKHFQEEQKIRVYQCLTKVYRRLGNKERAAYFNEELKTLARK